MPCYHPLPAWKSRNGEVSLGREPPDSQPLRLPCGSCLGCRTSEARAWALRCQLELQQHQAAVFTTLTYAENPTTLWKPDVQLWLKRLRKRLGPTPVRFLATGEYGEQRGRPHYHAILFGISADYADTIDKAWKAKNHAEKRDTRGHTHTVPVTPAAIAYVAGYCQKKIGFRLTRQIDPETGELLYEPPFRLMSRKPGLGGFARQWTESWRSYAIHNGERIPVPRYLHDSWKQNATKQQLEDLEKEKADKRALTETLTTEEHKLSLQAAEAHAAAKHNLRAAQRKYE